MNKDFNSNDLQVILAHAIDQLKKKLGDKFDINKINLEELRRLTGISVSVKPCACYLSDLCAIL